MKSEEEHKTIYFPLKVRTELNLRLRNDKLIRQPFKVRKERNFFGDPVYRGYVLIRRMYVVVESYDNKKTWTVCPILTRKVLNDIYKRKNKLI